MSRIIMSGQLAFVMIAIASTASAQGVRVFMAPDGEEASVPTTGNTTVYIAPGDAVDVALWIEDADETQELNAYQVILHWEATANLGATGSVDYVDTPSLPSADPSSAASTGSTVDVDAGRTDWVFAEHEAVSIFFHETSPPPDTGTGFGVGVILASINDFEIVTGIRYLLEFQIAASSDASGEHELRFVAINDPPAGGSFFVARGGQTEYFIGEFQSLTIVITQCGDGLVQGDEVCDDGNTDNEDGCSAACLVEQGFTCDGEPSACSIITVPFMTPKAMLVLMTLLVTGVAVVARKQAAHMSE